MVRCCLYLEGSADRFADELYVRSGRKRKVREHLGLMTPSNQLQNPVLQGGTVASGQHPSVILGKFGVKKLPPFKVASPAGPNSYSRLDPLEV